MKLPRQRSVRLPPANIACKMQRWRHESLMGLPENYSRDLHPYSLEQGFSKIELMETCLFLFNASTISMQRSVEMLWYPHQC